MVCRSVATFCSGMYFSQTSNPPTRAQPALAQFDTAVDICTKCSHCVPTRGGHRQPAPNNLKGKTRNQPNTKCPAGTADRQAQNPQTQGTVAQRCFQCPASADQLGRPRNETTPTANQVQPAPLRNWGPTGTRPCPTKQTNPDKARHGQLGQRLLTSKQVQTRSGPSLDQSRQVHPRRALGLESVGCDRLAVAKSIYRKPPAQRPGRHKSLL